MINFSNIKILISVPILCPTKDNKTERIGMNRNKTGIG